MLISRKINHLYENVGIFLLFGKSAPQIWKILEKDIKCSDGCVSLSVNPVGIAARLAESISTL